MSKIENAKRGISAGIFYNVLTIVLPFISRTLMINKMGTIYVGLGGLFNSILQVLSLTELGVGAVISYSLYKPLQDNNTDYVNSILNLLKYIYLFIGCIILFISVLLVPFLRSLIKGTVPEGINIYYLYIIYVVNSAIGYFLFGYKKVLFSAGQRYDLEVTITSIMTILQYSAQVIVLCCSSNYYLYVLVLPVATAMNNIVSNSIVKKKYPLYIAKGKLKKCDIQNILKLTLGSFFSKIGNTVFLSVDNIVISAFLGLTTLGVYNNYYYVFSSIISVFSVIHNTMRPIIGNTIIANSDCEIWKEFNIFNTVYNCLVVFCCSCCLSLIQDFELLWGGEANILSKGMVILFIIYFFVDRSFCVLALYQESAGLMWRSKFIPLLSAMINLVLNIVLVRRIGLYGILLSSIAAELIISIPGYIHIIFNYLFDNRKKIFYIKKYVLFITEAIIVCLTTFYVSRVICADSWGKLILKGILSAIISIGCLLLLNYRSIDIRFIIKKVISKSSK